MTSSDRENEDHEIVEWDVVNVGANLTPGMQSLFVDDCAISRTRVGPTGIIAQ